MGKKKKGTVRGQASSSRWLYLISRCVTIQLPWLGQPDLPQSVVLPSETTSAEIDHLCELIRTKQGPHMPVLGCTCREEAAGIIAAQHKRKESGALAAYEEQLNDVRQCQLAAVQIHKFSPSELQIGAEEKEGKITRCGFVSQKSE